MTKKTQASLQIGVVAPSAACALVELEIGLERLQNSGFKTIVHPQCKKKHLFFAGNDVERARAFFEMAHRGDIDILWAARGGYGAIRILPWLEQWTQEKGIPPKKIYVGFSDSTVFFDFLRKKWGWSVLHAPMPGLDGFERVTQVEWNALVKTLSGEKLEQPWGKSKLKFLSHAPESGIRAEIFGGNLTVLASLLGTPWMPDLSGKILFLEDVTELPFRLDRMMQQLLSAQQLKDVRALVLGTFVQCEDRVVSVLKSRPKTKQRSKNSLQSKKPLRPLVSHAKMLYEVFGSVGECLGISVATGLQVGHGPGSYPLPIGAEVELTPSGELRCLSWDGWG